MVGDGDWWRWWVVMLVLGGDRYGFLEFKKMEIEEERMKMGGGRRR